ncbi:hypothetical protein EIP86_003438 [Pleurotus ostreatoroseus]|nr:hypothetical protein EIP86_003438 [Pleurotus ostreatoroseus]
MMSSGINAVRGELAKLKRGTFQECTQTPVWRPALARVGVEAERYPYRDADAGDLIEFLQLTSAGEEPRAEFTSASQGSIPSDAMAAPRRPLPVPPIYARERQDYHDHHNSPLAVSNSYLYSSYISPIPHQPLPQSLPDEVDETNALRGGTLLHKGFYDLLALIPSTPSPSRFFWRSPEPETVSGPRYEDIRAAAPPAEMVEPITARTSPPAPLPQAKNLKARRISKDMVSKPTGFVHLVHASDADQAEALLSRWGPEGQGKVGNPHWADIIKNQIRKLTQAKAVNEVVAGLKPTESMLSEAPPPLRVVNGISHTSSSTITTAAKENVSLSPSLPSVSGLPATSQPGFPGSSTIRWTTGLPAHPEGIEDDASMAAESREHIAELNLPAKKPITPSLATLEKAVAARIYFENLYWPLLRHPPSREQRRVAMEKDMMNMQLSEAQKENLRARWRKNETDYLRERRRKVDLRKTDMLRKGQEGHVRAERDVLKNAALVNSPGGAEWIVRLYYSFQDREHLYLVLEYMGGGDLLNLLIERDVFEEDFTRFYVAEVRPKILIFGLSHVLTFQRFHSAPSMSITKDDYEQQRLHLLHKYGIDLEGFTPADGTRTKRLDRKEVERLMGGGDGQQGVFTWREKNSRKLAYSVCGTNSYMSPEVIRGHGYTYSCDWWSLGVIMFECLYGFPPFVSNSRHVTRQKILNWRQSLKFPAKPRVSHDAINLMQQLLCEPEDRLGSQATSSVSRPNSKLVQARRSGFIPTVGTSGSVDGAHLIKAHPWFRGIDWENIHRYTAPYRPDLRSPEDTRHFDDDIPPEPLAPANGAPADATRDPVLRDKVHGNEILEVRKALAFAGFTHKSPRVISYVRADKAFDPDPNTYGQDEPERTRGRATVRGPREIGKVGKGRAISM